MNSLIRTSLTYALLAGLLLGGSVSSVAAQEDCLLAVEPVEALAGSQFVLIGNGYTPSQLTLQRDTAQPVTFDLDLGDTDPFEIPIGSKSGDEGLWTATVTADDGCVATTTFRVALPSTDMIDGLLSGSGGSTPPAVYLLVVLAGFGGGVLVARYARARARLGA